MNPARPIVLSLGGNVGDVGAALARAVALVAELPQVRLTAVSAVYRTPAWGKTDQPDFLNIVALGETTLGPHDLLTGTQGIENRLGRVRDVRWGPRVIDIDLIVVGDESCHDARLTLPHPLAHERGFVLVPWLNADPAARLPGHGLVRDLVAGLDTGDIVRIDDLMIVLP